MLKRTIALLTAAVICMHSFAADGNKSGNPDPASRSGFSVRAGIGLTATRGNANLNSTACAWDIGAMYEWRFAKRWGLETGLALAHKGGAYRLESDESIVLRMHYLELPARLRLHCPLGSVDISPYIGAFYGYAVSGRLYMKDEYGGDYENVCRGKYNEIKRSDAGLTLGCGVTFKNGIYIGLNAEIGLLNIESSKEYESYPIAADSRAYYDDYGKTDKYFPYSVSLQVGFRF